MAKKKEVAKEVVVTKKPTIKQFDVILRPVITEKTMALMQAQNKVTVEVLKSSSKQEIKDAFEAVFGVKVENVNTVNVRSDKTRRGTQYPGRTRGYKKAVVTVADGEAIDLFRE